MSKNTWIDTNNALELIYTLMKEFSDNGSISFEGDVPILPLSEISNTTIEETNALKKTMSGKFFVVIPITEESISIIYKELSEKNILENLYLHIQIESEGNLVFGGYDGFDEDATFVSEGVPHSVLLSLSRMGVIRSV